MKQGRTIQDLAIELDRQREVKRDFLGDTRRLAVMPAEEEHRVRFEFLKMMIPTNGESEAFPVNNFALKQVADRLKIPGRFAQRLAEDHPDMLAYNVNALFSREPEQRMVRTLDGKVRAFLSKRYRILDNYDLAEAVLPHLAEVGAEITSCEVTETKLYIKAIRPDMVAEIPPPEGMEMGKGHNFFVAKVTAGIFVSNSEVGAGKLAISPAFFEQWCTNYAVVSNYQYKKYHLGRDSGRDDQELWEIFSDDTKKKTDEAIWAQVNDLTARAMDGTIFNKIVEDLKKARANEIKADPIMFVEEVSKRANVSEKEKSGILQHLIKRGEFTQYGLQAAVTRLSSDVEDYDRASELEQLGGDIIEMPKREWDSLHRAVEKLSKAA